MSDALERARAAAALLAQTRARVTGHELGDPANGIKPLRESAKALLKELQAEDAAFDCPALGAPVHVRTTGIKKVLSTSADARKLQVLPVLRELFESAERIATQEPYDGEIDTRAVAYHKLRAVVAIDGQPFAVRVVVKEDVAGKFHYDHSVHDIDALLDSTKKNASDDRGASDTTSNDGGLAKTPFSQCPTDSMITPVGDSDQVTPASAWAVFDGLVAVSTPLLDYTDSPVLATMKAELAEVLTRHEAATGRDRFVLAARMRALTARIERRQKLQPVKLQNRDRSTAASIAQVQSIGKNPDPDLLGYNKTPTEGAPIVFADYDEVSIPTALLGRKTTVTFTKDMTKAPVQFAVVPAEDVMVSHDYNGMPVEGYDALEAPEGMLRAVAGNGRAAGIQLAYEKGTAARYVEGLIEEADMLQLAAGAIAALARPMLVRVMRHEDVTADIGDKTNSSGMAGFSAVEQAKTDADRVDFGNLSFNEDGTPTLDALTRFVQAMPIAEQAALAPDGAPTNQALDRLMAATFNRAYQNDDLVKLYSQSLDPEIKNVLYGMAQAAGDMAALAGKGDYDIRGFVTDAASMASNAKRAGLPLSRMAEQRDIGMAEEANDIAGLFARNVRSAKKIGDALRTLARAALEEADGEAEDMFGPKEKRHPATLVAEIVAD